MCSVPGGLYEEHTAEREAPGKAEPKVHGKWHNKKETRPALSLSFLRMRMRSFRFSLGRVYLAPRSRPAALNAPC